MAHMYMYICIFIGLLYLHYARYCVVSLAVLFLGTHDF